MEGLLSMYASDSDEGAASCSSSASSEAPEASAPAARPSRKRRRPSSSAAAAAAGSSNRRKQGPPTGSEGSSSQAKAAGLPGLDDDFFAVSPNHVYTSVLTNGHRTLLGSASTAAASWTRAVPHIEGNWATHVYIRVPNTEAVLLLANACIAEGQRRLGARLLPAHSSSDEKQKQDRLLPAHPFSDEKEEKDDDTVLVPMDLRPAEEGGAQHLSLSRTLYLRSHHIDPFVADLHKALSWATSFPLGLAPPFGLLVNDERTRSFLTVGAGAGCGERLRRLVASVDSVVGRYRQPVYYEEPEFHVSVASAKGDLAGAWEEGEGTEGDGEGEERAEAVVVVDTVECRIGHKLFEIPLRGV